MRIRHLLIAMAMVASVGLASAAPAAATGVGVVRGEIEGDFVPQPCPDESGRVIAWLGTVEIDGETYGWVEFFGESRETPHFLYFEERWAIFDVGPDGVPDPEEACGPALIEGDEAGIGFFENPLAFAFGVVTGEPDFGAVTAGSRMFWRGFVEVDPTTGDPLSFDATIRIWPRR